LTQTPAAAPDSNKGGLHSKVRSMAVAVILLVVMTGVVFAVYHWQNSAHSTKAVVVNRSDRKNLPRPSPPPTSIVLPNLLVTSPVSSPSKPTVRKSSKDDFVTLISPVSVRNPSGKRIDLRIGSRFPLTAVQDNQVVIRYFDGRDYSIPISVTDRK
jgi:hypothetical protein